MDYEVEYNNRARVPEHPDVQMRWQRSAGAAREELDCAFDLTYADRPRNLYDVVHPSAGQGTDAPLIVFIHGGYWQRGDRKDYTGMASELSRRGLRVVLPSYTLCPDCEVGDIISEMRTLCATIWRRFARRPVICGHSAGGHLAAALLATDWSGPGDLPLDLVPAAYAISGVYDLSPLVSTTVNDALRLTSESAVAY
ncbi:MAG: alpha/beta hydrolase, partial [Hyphomicrobiaceae bacterium]